jgi:hypothetical protein
MLNPFVQKNNLVKAAQKKKKRVIFKKVAIMSVINTGSKFEATNIWKQNSHPK